MNPGSALVFIDASTGWRVGGFGGASTLDDHLAAAPIDQGFDWPGASVERSSDGGTSWRTVFDGTGPDVNGVWSVDALSDSDAWAVGVTALSQTHDGGASWLRLVEPKSDLLVRVDFVSNDLGWGVTTDGSLVVSTDGGHSWTAASFDRPVTSICLTPTTAYAVDEHGSVYTGDIQTGSLALVWKDNHSSHAAAWTQLSCLGSNVWVSAEYTQVEAHLDRGFYTVVSSQDSGATWITIASRDGPGQGSTDPPGVLAVNAISSTDTDGPFLVGFPESGWSLQVDRITSQQIDQHSSVDRFPHSRPGPTNAQDFLLVQGAARLGDQGWIQLTDDAADSAPLLILLHTTDGGTTWSILEKTSLTGER